MSHNPYGRKIPAPILRKMRTLYIETDIPCSKLAEKFGYNASTVSAHCTNGRWTALRDKYRSDQREAPASSPKSPGSPDTLSGPPDEPPSREDIELRTKRVLVRMLDLFDAAEQEADETGMSKLESLKALLPHAKSVCDTAGKLFGLAPQLPALGTGFTIALNTAPLPMLPAQPPTLDIPESVPAADSLK